MREIKFRAWNRKSHRMLTVGSFDTINSGQTPRRLKGPEIDMLVYVKVDDCILMQYTGLKDKNGVEIYEGDILRGIDIWTYPGVVTFDKEVGAFVWTWGEEWGRIEYCFLGIIGNIHENPELLETEDD